MNRDYSAPFIEIVPHKADEPAYLLGRLIDPRDQILDEATRGLPDGIKLFDIHINPSGSMIFFLDYGHERSSIVIAPGDDPVGRFHKLLKEAIMAREIGMKKGASAKAKAYDEMMDKKKGLKEGSPRDLAMDKKAMKKFPAKKGK